MDSTNVTQPVPGENLPRRPVSLAGRITIITCQAIIAGLVIYSVSIMLDRHEPPTQPPASVEAPRPGGTVSTPIGTLDVPPAGQLPSDVPFGSRPPQPTGADTRPGQSGTGQAPGSAR